MQEFGQKKCKKYTFPRFALPPAVWLTPVFGCLGALRSTRMFM